MRRILLVPYILAWMIALLTSVHPIKTLRERRKRNQEARQLAYYRPWQEARDEFLRTEDDKAQAAKLRDAKDALAVRERSYTGAQVAGGLLGGGEAALLAQLYPTNTPAMALACFIVGLIAQACGFLAAWTELFRRLPKGPATDRGLYTEKGINARSYAEWKQRTSHLQRKLYRLRWATSISACWLVTGLLYMVPPLWTRFFS